MLHWHSVYVMVLFVTRPASPPPNVSLTATSRSVEVTWGALECIEIIEYSVTLWREGGPLHMERVTDLSYTRDGLVPYTNYTFQVAVVNSNGRGPNFTTTFQTTEDGMSVFCKIVVCL